MDTDSRDHELDAKADELAISAPDVSDLFAASDVLGRQLGLRSMLSDASVAPEVREQVARRLFAGRIGPGATDLVAAAVFGSQGSRALVASIERQGVRAALLASGALTTVQDEVFRFARTLQANSDLHQTLTDPLIEVAARQNLVDDLLGAKARPATIQLIKRAIQGSGRTLVKTLDHYVAIASEVRQHRVAKVTVAQPITGTQQQQLRDQLARIYGVAIDVQVNVDPSVLGGARIELGDELIDGTILNRLNDARRLIG
jgi:F-type H+-transporting ATPase subunit delta